MQKSGDSVPVTDCKHARSQKQSGKHAISMVTLVVIRNICISSGDTVCSKVLNNITFTMNIILCRVNYYVKTTILNIPQHL